MVKPRHPNEHQPQPADSDLDFEDAGVEDGGLPEGSPTVEDQLQTALAESAANHDRYLRAQAELETYRRRVHKEREEDRRYAAVPVVRELLPVLDNLQRAVEAADKADSVADLKAGVDMVLQQSLDVLKKLQVTPIEAMGQPFDPNQHEAISQMPSADHPPMTVLHEVERGYTLHDRVIRPSKVIVSS
jgi:molecular chaperone GrpE